jgi:hypothetical protein
MTSLLRRVAVAAVSGGLAGALLLANSGSVLAYGNAAAYQIEISGNYLAPGFGFGVWLWIELDANGTGDYTGSDCGYEGPGLAGAAADRGDVTWTTDGTTLTINGVVLNGVPPNGVPVTITVPADYGHYKTSIAAVFGVPLPGWVQLQVAP